MSHPDLGVLQAVLDGELAAADEALGAAGAAQAHLASCEACRTRLEEMRATMMEADGLVARLDGGTAGRRDGAGQDGRTAGRRRFRMSMGQTGIAAGLLVAVTAGLMLREQRLGTAALDSGRTQRPDGMAEASSRDERPSQVARVGGDTFRLRAGGVEEGKAEAGRRSEVPAAPTPPARDESPRPAVAREADARNDARENEAVPASGADGVQKPVGEVATVPEKVTARQDAPSPAPAAAAAPLPQKIEGNYPPAMRARPLGSSVIARPRAIGSLVPIRVDTLAGTFRSTYRLGHQLVVLEESVRPLPAGDDARDAAAGLAAKVTVTEYRWEVRGTQLRLSGPVSRDSLIALSTLVR